MKELTKAEFLRRASLFYDKLTQDLDTEKQDFYEFESKLDELVQEFGKELMQESMGAVGDNVRQKKKFKQGLAR